MLYMCKWVACGKSGQHKAASMPTTGDFSLRDPD